MKPALAIAVLFVLASCSSGDTRIYEKEDPPRLRDGTITMRTFWAPGNDKKVDIRRIKARDGRVTAELISPERGHTVGDVPEGAWSDLWQKLLAMDPFGKAPYGVQPDDPSGGPYHLVRLELGREGSEFSAQLRQNLLVFSSQDVTERLKYSGAIADVVTKYATQPLADPAAAAATPPAK